MDASASAEGGPAEYTNSGGKCSMEGGGQGAKAEGQQQAQRRRKPEEDLRRQQELAYDTRLLPVTSRILAGAGACGQRAVGCVRPLGLRGRVLRAHWAGKAVGSCENVRKPVRVDAIVLGACASLALKIDLDSGCLLAGCWTGRHTGQDGPPGPGWAGRLTEEGILQNPLLRAGTFTATDVYDHLASLAKLRAAAVSELQKADCLLVPTALAHFTVQVRLGIRCAVPVLSGICGCSRVDASLQSAGQDLALLRACPWRGWH